MRVTWIWLIVVAVLFSQESEQPPIPSVEIPPAEIAITAEDLIAKTDLFKSKKAKAEEGYKINYNTVSIIEYIRFASKICKVNFIYEESDLNFTVTVVSDEPATAANVMATLLQVLRIHGLSLLEQDNNLVIHKSADVKQVASLVKEGDPKSSASIVTRIFRIKNAKPASIAAVIQPMISGTALLETSAETRQIILTDITANVDKIALLIENLDSPHTLFEIRAFAAQHNRPEVLIALASQIMTPIAAGNPFILVPHNMAGEIYIVSSPELVARAIEVLTSLDTPAKPGMAHEISPGVLLGTGLPGEKSSFFVYKPQYRSAEKIKKSILEMAENLKGTRGADQSFIDTIESVKINASTQTLSFSGEEKNFARVQELLAKIDLQGGKGGTGPATQFYIYKPLHQGGDAIEEAIKEVAGQLKSDKLADPGFLNALGTMKWVKSTESLMFTGDPASLQKVQALIGTIDVQESAASSNTYFIYKVRNTTGELIEEDLDNLAKNFKSSGHKDAKILDVISKIRYVKETNSLFISGDAKAVEEVKQLIVQYDYPRESKGPSSSNFYMYKPQYLKAKEIEKSLKDVSANLKTAGLADPSLLKAIDSAKYVSTTNSLIFTGTPDALSKIQSLIKDIDVASVSPASVQRVGKTSFLLYKLKLASGPQVVSAMKNLSGDLKKSGATDKNLLDALNSMKYVKETNSLFFSGDEESLARIQGLVEKFDVPSLAGPAEAGNLPVPTSGASNFFVYRPSSLPGQELEKLLVDFAEHLKSSGLYDPDLFSAITSMRWTDKTQTLVFTGSPKALAQVKDLLKEFDIQSNMTQGAIALPSDQSIQSIDNTSFLVYKLQFHKGDEIQGALRQIAKDLTMSNAQINQGLLNSINSIQWLEVTNSLLCSGDQDTLTRLRELIKSLDLPLKQVFVEMLVIQTTLTNALNFGLEWGANYKFKNKFGAGSYNSAPFGTAPDNFMNRLSSLTPPAPPTPLGNIPISSGFDLGVIGEVIKHNGETFLTLGSLMSALQLDSESSIVMTPKLITQDGRTSSIFVGENIPFVGSFVQNNSQNTVNTSNIEYRDIGFNLTITPVLGNSDIVTLDINLDRSQTVTDVSGAAINFNSQSAQGIITSKTTMNTTVHVPDNHFLILSGMVNNSNVKSKSGIPCLGGLPLVGAAFTKNNDTSTNSNIVIFLRPHIINSIDDMRKVTTKEETYFRDQAGTPFLERHFDEGMELIKTVDDE